jgi:hypothetical protein
MLRAWIQRLDVVIAIGAGVAYGIVAQLVVRLSFMQGLWAVMTFGYVFALPFALGMLAASGLRPERGLGASIGAGLSTAAVCLVVALAVGWEGTICLAMIAPVYLGLALVGALVGHRARRRARGAGRTTLAIALLPLLSAGGERALQLPAELRTVQNSIDIRAPEDVVWREIVRVKPIHEPQTSWLYTLGFPRPVEATLSHEGIGGVRHARFERGLLFIETITQWHEQRDFRFQIAVDPAHTPLTTLDPHVTVGGEYFDVLEGGYRIEPLAQDHVRLHLDSRHRISTHFNFYASLWSTALMSEIQRNILGVIKARAEAALPLAECCRKPTASSALASGRVASSWHACSVGECQINRSGSRR